MPRSSICPAIAVAAILGSAVLAAGPAAQAQADAAALMADFFKGALEIDNPNGDWHAKRYLAADHTYRETGSDGEVHGTWTVKDGKICTTADHLLGADRASTYCNTGLGKRAGESWKDADPITGNVVLFKLSAGR
jgi:hypothetical protein